MKLTRHGLLPLVLGFALLVSGCSIGGCGADKPPAEATGPVFGVVNLETAVRQNPNYTQYKALEEQYDNLNSQYKAEQQSLTAKSQAQAMALSGLSQNSAIIDSLNTELQAKLAAKEQEINTRLQQNYIALIQKYRNQVNFQPTEADLQIVNLQLALRTLKMTDAEKAAKEKELEELLAKRGQSVQGNNQELENRVAAEMEPMKAEAEKEMEAYAASLHQELSAKRDSEMQSQANAIIAENALPDPSAWNSQWQKRLDGKKAEVKAMHDAILEDIRSRVAAIAEEKKIDMVVINYEANVKAVDLTNDIVASYGTK